MLNVNGLSFRYRGGEPLLKGVSFSIGAGQCAAVLGNNGAGKSTLMKCVGRLLNANAGSVQLNGSELTQLSHREIAKRVAFVAQSAPRTRLTVPFASASALAKRSWWRMLWARSRAALLAPATI